jgi:hypothetical protein
VHVFSFLFLIIMSGLFAISSLSVYTLCSITLSHLHIHTTAWACVYSTFLLFQCQCFAH